MSARLPRDLIFLEQAGRSLTEATTLGEIKLIRDKAEAARQYAKSAGLGLQIQNLAAELKLRAERRAGNFLAGLSMRGGNRRSHPHYESVKLVDLGIDHNKSARWQMEAAIPEQLFLTYLSASAESGLEITTQGLLRFATKTTIRDLPGARSRRGHTRPLQGPAVKAAPQIPADGTGRYEDHQSRDTLRELEHQRNLLASLLGPFCRDHEPDLGLACKRTVMRLLEEMRELLSELIRSAT